MHVMHKYTNLDTKLLYWLCSNFDGIILVHRGSEYRIIFEACASRLHGGGSGARPRAIGSHGLCTYVLYLSQYVLLFCILCIFVTFVLLL